MSNISFWKPHCLLHQYFVFVSLCVCVWAERLFDVSQIQTQAGFSHMCVGRIQMAPQNCTNVTLTERLQSQLKHRYSAVESSHKLAEEVPEVKENWMETTGGEWKSVLLVINTDGSFNQSSIVLMFNTDY